MKRNIVKISGIVVVVFALVANLQYALISYGLKNHQASLGALAGTTGSGTSSGTTGTGTGTGTDDPNDPWLYSMPNDVDGYDGDYTGTTPETRELKQVRCVKVGVQVHFPLKESTLSVSLGHRMKCKKSQTGSCTASSQNSCN